MSNEDRFQPTNFNRPPRIQPLTLPQEEVNIPAPPNLPDLPEQNWLVSIIPVMGIGVMAMFYVFRSVGSTGGSALFAIPLLILAIFTIGGTLLTQRWRRSDFEKRRYESTLNYIRLLEKKRTRLQAAHNAQIALLRTNFPNPQDGLKLALSRDAKLWERRPIDPDFTAFRLGLGRIPFSITITTPDPDVDSEDLDRALEIADTYRYLNRAPAILSLQQSFSLGVYGKRNITLESVRSIICQLALAHAPQDLKIHLIAPQAYRDSWRWLEWLPHAHFNQQTAADLLAFDPDHIRNLLGNLSQTIDQRKEHQEIGAIPHLLVIMDDPRLAESEPVYETLLREGHLVGASVLCIVNRYEDIPGDCKAVIEIDDEGRFNAYSSTQALELTGAIDRLSVQNAEHVARALAAVVVRQTGGGGRIPQQVDFLNLYSVRFVEDLHEKITQRWRRPIANGALPYPVPIGQESLAVATTILLDEAHHGPHGVLAGTTGSGKSGLLQSLICSLAIEHDPRLATFLLIDFKGGSTFNIFDDLPHTVGTVTNLDVVLVERALEALKAETQARQQFLKRMNVRDIVQYHRYFARTDTHVQDPSYQPLPHLFIIVDEFAQLAKEMPDFLRELVRTAQVGRSLGLHLILGTQSPMDVITDEMNANMQFRICLRVQNIEASRAMLRRPDAAYLPAGWPGRGYFQVGERGMFKQFQAAFVGGDYQQSGDTDAQSTENAVLELITDDGAVVDLLASDAKRFASQSAADNILAGEPYTTVRAISETLVHYTRQHNVPWMPPILLPPLDEQISLVAPFEKTTTGGWDGRKWQPSGQDHAGHPIHIGSAPVGLLDDIYRRTQNPLWVHLNTGEQESSNRRDGHLLIIGGPGTGKTTFLRTLAISQALLHSPDQLHMYFLSFTGGGLNDVSRLPHAENVVHGTETERVRRLFGRLIHILDTRQSGQADDEQPAIMLCIDQYEQFRDSYFDQHVKDFERLIYEGRAVGIYLILTASSISVIPDRLRSLIQQRIALQLGNPSDYMLAVGHLNTRIERVLPRGRGYIYHSPPLLCQISLPSLQSPGSDDEDIRLEMVALIEAMCGGYLNQQGIRPANATPPEQMQSPSPILELPTQIPLATLPVYQGHSEHIVTPLGCSDDDRLSVFNLDWWESGPHFIVTGPPGSGKTNMLHAAILSASRQYSPEEVRFLLVDFGGRSLRTLAPLKHVIGRATDVVDLQAQLINLEAELQAFQADWQQDDGDDLPAQVPKTVIIFDDYDITSETLSTHAELLRRLRDHVRLHSEFGLHVWVSGYLERIGDPLIKQLLLKRSGFGFSIRDSLHNLNVRVSDLPNEAMPEGRVFFAQQNIIRVIQTTLIENPQQWIKQINEQIWPKAGRAQWQNPVQPIVQPNTPKSPQKENDVEVDIDTDGLIEDLLGS
jgi:DNA segregation ATPase FtsK/SpoIIIE, S-DNA-T family